MADNSDIEWTDATWNPITGCSVVSPGCTNCYAMRLAGTRLQHHPSRAGLTRDSKAGPVWTGEVRFNTQWLDQPLRWSKPRMIFVCAHSDLFHESVPDEWIDRVFAVMALAPWHTFQVLTKRAERMRAYLTNPGRAQLIWRAADRIACERQMPETHPADSYLSAGEDAATLPLPNVWLGISAEDQRRADERIPRLLATPAAVRWVSAEPLLGHTVLHHIKPLDGDTRSINALSGEVWYPGCGSISSQTLTGPRIDWIVAGGESGPGARPSHPEWARSLRDQCASAGVPFHHKQNGAWLSVHDVGYATWDRTGRRDGQVLGRVSEFRGRGIPGLEGHDWPSDYPFPNGADPGPVMINVGKARAGRLLDGVEHNGMPGQQP